MNDNTTKLIEQLATKLGTTTEYLWGVLMKQAQVDAIITLIQILIIIFFGVWVFRTHVQLMKPIPNDKYGDNGYEKHEWKIFAMGASFIILAVFIITAFFSIDDVINGFFNPEYWALKEVLFYIK